MRERWREERVGRMIERKGSIPRKTVWNVFFFHHKFHDYSAGDRTWAAWIEYQRASSFTGHLDRFGITLAILTCPWHLHAFCYRTKLFLITIRKATITSHTIRSPSSTVDYVRRRKRAWFKHVLYCLKYFWCAGYVELYKRLLVLKETSIGSEPRSGKQLVPVRVSGSGLIPIFPISSLDRITPHTVSKWTTFWAVAYSLYQGAYFSVPHI